MPDRRLSPWLVAALVAGAGAAVQAQNLDAIGNQWLHGALAQSQSTASLPLRMEVQIGQLDARLNLAPCQQVEPYLPNGSRLWGRTRIGMRCVQGAKPWNVFVPVTVKAWGPAWVLSRAVNQGEVLDASSAMQAEVDWAAESAPIVALPEDWIGQTASRALPAGVALRSHLLRAPQLFKAGETVKLVLQGSGFAVSGMGKAMQNGGAGETVRVRMDNGRSVSGTVNAEGQVVVAH